MTFRGHVGGRWRGSRDRHGGDNDDLSAVLLTFGPNGGLFVTILGWHQPLHR